ncbi:MAG TPA: uracil-DNA glycosylase [Nitrolancea sp.]|jgi:DNA polymerase|nr:uracil-DNA glycosylase [Nitrolancea sp.]
MTSDRANQRDERLAELEKLARRLADSDKVSAVRGESRLVFGTGDPCASLVLVGEAPGADEEKQGRPFVGRAGRLLDDALEQAGLSRSDIWITNVVKIRPTEAGANDRLRNRPPTTEEKNTFRPWLEQELAIIAPRSVVCVGATAAAALLGRTVKISAERGHWLDGPVGTQVLTTYHPAYLLRPFRDRDERFQQFVDDLRVAAGRV